MFSKIGSAVRQANADRKSAKDEAAREHQERAQAAGVMVTSGVFGVSTIEIYEGGYVRVAEGTENHARPAETTKNTPYEKLRSISFGGSEIEAAASAEPAPNSPLEGAVMQAMSGIVKGGKLLTKGTVIGVATTGISQIAANSARKSNLVIGTDRAIHTLTNQRHNGFLKVSQKEHDAVARALVEAGHAVLGISSEPKPSGADMPDAVVVAAVPATPTLSDRLRELSELHREGILSDDEFSAAKGKLLGGL